MGRRTKPHRELPGVARAVLAACVVLLAVTAATAQTGGITVLVGDEDGNPLADAQVTISHETGSVRTTTDLTDKKGIRSSTKRPNNSVTPNEPSTSPTTRPRWRDTSSGPAIFGFWTNTTKRLQTTRRS